MNYISEGGERIVPEIKLFELSINGALPELKRGKNSGNNPLTVANEMWLSGIKPGRKINVMLDGGRFKTVAIETAEQTPEGLRIFGGVTQDGCPVEIRCGHDESCVFKTTVCFNAKDQSFFKSQ